MASALERIPAEQPKQTSVSFSKSCPSLHGAPPHARPASAVSGGPQRRRLQEALSNGKRVDAIENASASSQVARRTMKPSASMPTDIGTATVPPLGRRQKRPATAGGFIRCVSSAAQTQNGKAQEIEARLVDYEDNRSKEARMTATMTTRSSVVVSDVDNRRSLLGFDDEIKEFEGDLQKMLGRIRMEGVVDSKTRKKMELEARLAEEKRKKDEATRKLRQAAKEAQNPKRRVALKMETFRAATNADIAVKVPTKSYIADGGSGPELVPMVDIRLLQSKAIGLNGAGTFKAIYEIACDHEKSNAWEIYALGPPDSRPDLTKRNKRPASLMSRTESATQARLCQQQQRYEEREKQAQVNRHQHSLDKSLQQLSAMRVGVDFSQDTFCNPGAAKALKQIAAVPRGAFESGQSPHAASRLQKKFSTVSRDDVDVSHLQPGNSDGVSRPFYWGVVRGMMGMMWLLRLVRSRHQAANQVKFFLDAVERFGLLKARAKHLVHKVVSVQRVCRAFLERKRQWTVENTWLWNQKEDDQLTTYFRKAIAAVLMDPNRIPDFCKKEEANKSRSNTWAADSGTGPPPGRADPPPAFNWKDFKIPLKHRKFALGRWYMRQLQRKVQAHKLWLTTIEMGVSQKKDLEHFFELIGVESTESLARRKTSWEMSEELALDLEPPTAFLTLSDQDILELIATSAQELSRQNVHPFNKHDGPRHPACAKGIKNAPTRGTAKQMRLRSKETISAPKSRSKEGNPNDLDAVFARFTPRLRQIHDESAAAVENADLMADAFSST